MKKIWKRIGAALAGTILSAFAVMAPAITSMAAELKSFTENVNWKDVNSGDIVATTEFTYNVQDPNDYYYPGDVYVRYAEYELWEGNHIFWVKLHNSPSYFRNGDVLIIRLPMTITENNILDGYLSDEKLWQVDPSGNTLVFTFIGEHANKIDDFELGVLLAGSSSSADTNWLDPLRTQLAIAADPEIGKNVNNTVEYTGDFALPAETMQFLKDHPEVTLKYTFDYKGETHTVVIPGKSVVIEEGVPWYGFENLLGRYGK